MSVFGKIMSAIFGSGAHAQPTTPITPDASPTPSQAPTTAAAAAAPSTPTTTNPAQPSVDVAAVLNGLAAKNPEKLDWRHSIVDLMKLLDLDSSLAARKELAGEFHYDGDTSDTATMNQWLHKQVMAKLAANGGVVPADLKD